MSSWSDEMNEMLSAFDRQVKCSMGNIKKAFKRDGLSLDAEFRQYFLRVSNERIKNVYDEFTVFSMYEDRVFQGNTSATGEYQTMTSIHTQSHFMKNPQRERHSPNEIIESSDEEAEIQNGVKFESTETQFTSNFGDLPELNDNIQFCDDGSNSEMSDINSIEKIGSEVKGYDDTSLVGFDFLRDIDGSNEKASPDTFIKRPFANYATKINHMVGKSARSARKSGSTPKSSSSEKSISSNHLEIKKRFKCQLCKYSNNYKSQLNRHMRSHTGEKPHRCDICRKGFTRMENLKKHKVTHTNEIPFHCRGCFTGFSQKIDQVTHEKVCKSRRYECHICKKFITVFKTHLEIHMRTHNGERPYKCEICAMCFTQKGSLKNHLDTIHSRSKL